MKPFRGKLRLAGLLVALYAMVFQALIPFAQGIPVEREDGGFDSLIICTAWGTKLLQLSTSEETPVKQTGELKCPVCSVHNLKLALPGVDVPAPEPAFIHRGERLSPPDFAAADVASVPRAAIRAPPVSV